MSHIRAFVTISRDAMTPSRKSCEQLMPGVNEVGRLIRFVMSMLQIKAHIRVLIGL